MCTVCRAKPSRVIKFARQDLNKGRMSPGSEEDGSGAADQYSMLRIEFRTNFAALPMSVVLEDETLESVRFRFVGVQRVIYEPVFGP